MDLKKIQVFVVFYCVTEIIGTPVGIQNKYIKRDVSSRIVGGTDAPEGYATWMVALLIGDVIKMMNCGGSIISPRHVLTAAHCVDSNVIWGELLESFHGVIGSNSWSKATIKTNFKSFAIHPGWSWNTIKNDISVLTTDKDIVFNDRVGPIKLNLNFVDGKIESFVTGWGNLELFGKTPDKLQLLRVNKLSSSECVLRMWWAAILDNGRSPPYDPQLELCTLHSVRHGVCHGDSGSALVDQGSREQIGIVSWGFPCATGQPDVFVRVSAFADFLTSVVDGL